MTERPGRSGRRRRRREPPEDVEVAGDLRALLAGEEDAPVADVPADLPPLPEHPPEADLSGTPAPQPPGAGGWEVIEQMFQGPAPSAEPGFDLAASGSQAFSEPTLDEVVRRLEDLGHSVGTLERRVREASTARAEPARPVVPQALTARLAALEERIDMLLEGGRGEDGASGLQMEQVMAESRAMTASVEAALQELRALIEGAQAQQAGADGTSHSLLENMTAEITGQVITETVDRLTDFELGIAERLEALEAQLAERQDRFQEKVVQRVEGLEGQIVERVEGLSGAVAEGVEGLSGRLVEGVEGLQGQVMARGEGLKGQLADRLAGLEERLIQTLAEREAEAAAAREIIGRVSEALARDPFELVSTEDIDELTAGIAAKVRRMSRRVDRLEAILERGLADVEQARRQAAAAALEMERSARRAAELWRAVEAGGTSAAKGAAKRAPATRATPPAKTTAREPAPRRRPGRTG